MTLQIYHYNLLIYCIIFIIVACTLTFKNNNYINVDAFALSRFRIWNRRMIISLQEHEKPSHKLVNTVPFPCHVRNSDVFRLSALLVSDDDTSDESDERLFQALMDRKLKMGQQTQNYDREYLGAGVPRSSLRPEEMVPLLMNALKYNDIPHKDAGLVSMWEFATDTVKFIFNNNVTEFIESCHDTADQFPTSFYGAAMDGKSWDIETELNRVGGKDGWIATQVIKTISSDGRLRRWQWEMRKNRRPPCQGCWKIENIASSDRNGDFEARDRGDGWSV